MAEKPIKGTGEIKESDFKFQLDGLATYEQFDKLLKLTKAYTTKGLSASEVTALNKALGETAQAAEAAADAMDDVVDAEKAKEKSLEKTRDSLDALSTLSGSTTGNFKGLTAQLGSTGLVLGSMVGAIMGLTTDVSTGLQMGIGGQIMDFAIAAKTAGISTTAFASALKETGGGFAMLGTSATSGSKQFGALVNSVRSATKSVGNLGLNNEELAKFTAQQVKLAVQQGFKGKAAAKLVENNSKVFAESISEMSNATGKAVTELAAAALKLGSDPLVSSFVASAKMSGAEISAAAKQFAVNAHGIFGEMGDALAIDALKSAMSGLPFAITNSGKNMLIASSALYNEFEKQADIVKNGGQLTKQNAEDMRNIALAEVEARGDQIRTMAMLDGPAGESAKQMLQLAQEAKFYNSEAGQKRRKEDEAAAAFMAASNQFSANLQALALPFMNLVNGVNWSLMISVLNGFAVAVQTLMYPFTALGNLLQKTGFGEVFGSMVSIVSGLAAGLVILSGTGKLVASGFTGLSKMLGDSVRSLALFKAGVERSAPGGGPGIPPGGAPGSPQNRRMPSRLAVQSATVALIGFGTALEGSRRIQEDADDTLGHLMSTLGDVVGLFSLLVPLLASMAGGNGLKGILDKVGGFAGSGKLGKIAKFGGAAAGGLAIGKDMYDIASGSDQENKGANWGGVAGGAALGIVGAIFGGPVGAAIGMSLGNTIGELVGSSFDSAESAYVSDKSTSGASVDIMKAQVAAVDQSNLKRSETDSLLRENNKAMAQIADNTGAQVGISNRTATATSDTARYTRQQANAVG